MRPPAQLLAVAIDLDDSHRLGDVLLAKEHVDAELLGVAQAHPGGCHVQVATNLLVDAPLDLAQRRAWGRSTGREVEAQPVRTDPATNLLRLFADDVPQRPMEQMRPGMVPCRSPAGALVDVRLDHVTRRHLALDPSDMHDRRPHPLGVVDAHSSAWTDELATIADLAATLRVEGRALENDQPRTLT